jgi:serine phosphatase RsbU (regulator of sigma subunit)
MDGHTCPEALRRVRQMVYKILHPDAAKYGNNVVFSGRDAMKLPFRAVAPVREVRHPAPAALPKLADCTVAAMYRATRVGGDYYDFLFAESCLIFMFLDIAGRREEALDVAAVVQQRFQAIAPGIFQDGRGNRNDQITDLTIELNRTIIDASGGVRCAPAFLGCYDEAVGVLSYINAGHTPAVLKDEDGITLFRAAGPPLGLFSHSTHDAQVSTLRPGAALVLVSKGLVESRAGSHEFGTERVQEFITSREFQSAQEICSGLLKNLQQFIEARKSLFRHPGPENDATALALLRAAAAQRASAALA